MFTPSVKLSERMVSQFKNVFIRKPRELTLCEEVQASSHHRIEKQTVVFVVLGYCVWQSSGRRLATVHDLGQGASAILAREVAIYDCSDVGVVDPLGDGADTGIVNDHDRRITLTGHRQDETIRVAVSKRRPIPAFACQFVDENDTMLRRLVDDWCVVVEVPREERVVFVRLPLKSSEGIVNIGGCSSARASTGEQSTIHCDTRPMQSRLPTLGLDPVHSVGRPVSTVGED